MGKVSAKLPIWELMGISGVSEDRKTQGGCEAESESGQGARQWAGG